MEVIKSVTEEGNKFYLIEVLYIKGNKTFYPYFSGYYASGMPIELKEGVDEDSPILTYQDIKVAYDEYEALSLLMITEDNNDDNRKLAEEMVNEKIKAALVNEIEKFIKEEEEMEKMISENKNGFGWYGNMDEMNRRDGLFNKSNDKDEEFDGEKPKVTLKDVAGLDEVKVELKELIEGFNNKEKFEKFKVKPPRGVLLEGDPGNGKTLISKAIAGEANASFYFTAGSEFTEKYVGVGPKRIRDLFAKARKNRPAIIMIDEIDAVGAKREEDNNKEDNKTLNQLLVELASDDNDDLLVIGTTNRKDILDPALLRKGRLDRHIFIPNPDKKTRHEILKLHADGKPLADDVDLEVVAQQTHGMCGADMEGIIIEGAMIAIREDADEINQSMLLKAIDRQIAGLERKSTVMVEREKKIVSIHEASHLVVGMKLNSRKPSKITVVPHANSLGYVLYHENEDRFISTKEELMNLMKTSLAGAVGEKVFFGHESSGCSGDLGSVSSIAKRMVCEYGMSGLGKMKIDERNGFMQEKIHEEMKKIVDEAYSNTLMIVEENKKLIEYIGKELETKETLNEDEIDKLVSDFDK